MATLWQWLRRSDRVARELLKAYAVNRPNLGVRDRSTRYWFDEDSAAFAAVRVSIDFLGNSGGWHNSAQTAGMDDAVAPPCA